jgi:hypothetical protein
MERWCEGGCKIVGGEGWQDKVYTVTERNGRSSWEQQGIIAFCTCQWNEWMSLVLVFSIILLIWPGKIFNTFPLYIIGTDWIVKINDIKRVWHEQEAEQTRNQYVHCWPSRHGTQIWLFRLALCG